MKPDSTNKELCPYKTIPKTQFWRNSVFETEKGLVDVIEKLHFITKEYSIHMMPVSKKNENEGWIKTYQTFHNNSVEWWVEKFKKKFSLVQVVDSSWSDHISIGKWFICYK